MTCGQDLQAVAPNPSAADPEKHVRYNLGMVLGVDDFVQEFTYHNAHRAWLARDALGYGTVWGLRVVPEDDATQGPRILIECGAALSPRGQLIHVSPAQCAYLNAWLAVNQTTIIDTLGAPPSSGDTLTLYAVLAYDECATDDVPLAGEPCRTEDQLSAPSRTLDYFRLQLRLTPPSQPEEEAVRNFVKALLTVDMVDASEILTPPISLSAFETAVRASPIADSNDFSFAGVVIDIADAAHYFRSAMRIWTVELRPRYRPQWLASSAACTSSGTAPTYPDEEDYLLLAKIEFPLSIDAISGSWSVVNAAAVTLDEENRPYLLHQRMLQEFVINGIPLSTGEITTAPVVPLVGDEPSYRVVAAGVVRADNLAIGPVYGDLKAVSVASGEVVFAFTNYAEPDDTFQYVVKVLPQPTASVSTPTVRFLEFRPTGFALRVTRGSAHVSAVDLNSMPFMLEVTRIG